MGIGLLLTFGAGVLFPIKIEASWIVMLGFIMAILGLIVLMNLNLPPIISLIFYIIFCVVKGIMFSFILLQYNLNTILFAFLGASFIFIAFSVMGFIYKEKFLSFGRVLYSILFSMIAITLLNLFIFRSGILDLILAYAGIVVFALFTAHDIQILDRTFEDSKYKVWNRIIIGALNLYLDFINIFLDLLRIIDKK